MSTYRTNTLGSVLRQLEQIKETHGEHIEVYRHDGESGEQAVLKVEVADYHGGGPLIVVIH